MVLNAKKTRRDRHERDKALNDATKPDTKINTVGNAGDTPPSPTVKNEGKKVKGQTIRRKRAKGIRVY